MTHLHQLAHALKHHGVDRIFGIPGTQTVPLLEAFRSVGLEFTVATHEGNAAFMANGFARAGNATGVVSTIGGPGLTNALTGLAEARHDSVPILLICSASPQKPGNAFRLQALDQRAITTGVVKGWVDIGEDGRIDEAVDEAFQRIESGEPGPVLMQLHRGAGPRREEPFPAPAPMTPDPSGWSALTRRWQRARYPLLYLGQGSFSASGKIRALVAATGVPVLTTPSGRGVVPEIDPAVLGFDPLRGGVALANELLGEADLIVAVGCRFSHNGSAGFQLRIPEAALVHVDVEPSVLGANYPASLTRVGTADETFSVLLAAALDEPFQWKPSRLASFRDGFRPRSGESREPLVGGGPAAEFFHWLRQVLPPDAVLVTDSGQHQIVTRRYFDVLEPRGLMVPNDFQSMGFGIPAAIGARLALPDRPVAALVGDGGFLMSGMEVTTAVREHLPILFVVFNDGHLNQIRLQQLGDHGHASGVNIGRLDLDAFADAAGASYLAFHGGMAPNEVRRAFLDERPTILEVPVGDSPGLEWLARRVRLKESVRKAVGPERVGWVQRWLRRGR